MEEEVTTIEGNTDINQALEEFEQKSQIEKVQKTVLADKKSELPMMVRFVMKISGGAIKEQKQAEWVLLGFVIVAIGISLFLLFGGGNKNTLTTTEQSQLNTLQQLQNSQGFIVPK